MAETAFAGAVGASGAVIAGDASCGGIAGSVAGAGVSVTGLGESTTGCDASGAGVSSGGISRFYSTGGLCFGRMTQQDESFAIWGYRRRLDQ